MAHVRFTRHDRIVVSAERLFSRHCTRFMACLPPNTVGVALNDAPVNLPEKDGADLVASALSSRCLTALYFLTLVLLSLAPGSGSAVPHTRPGCLACWVTP